MPNIFRVRMFPLAPGLPPREVIFWFVPVDDENYQRFFLEAIRMPKDQIEGFMAKRREIVSKQTMPARWPNPSLRAGCGARRWNNPPLLA